MEHPAASTIMRPRRKSLVNDRDLMSFLSFCTMRWLLSCARFSPGLRASLGLHEHAAFALEHLANGRLVPELGETNATAQQIAIRQLARQIVNLMEEPW